jgi:hypothetical protein
MFILMSGTFAVTYFLLPFIQKFCIQSAAGGSRGRWIVRPITAFHFGAAAISSAVLLGFLARPLGKRWRKTDIALGSRYDPFSTRKKVAISIKATIYGAIYLTALFFYLISWEEIGPNGITQHLPWGIKKFDWSEVTRLERIPAGYRSDELAQDGPWANIFVTGREIDLSRSNEGLSEADLDSIENYITQKTGKHWQLREDARATQ